MGQFVEEYVWGMVTTTHCLLPVKEAESMVDDWGEESVDTDGMLGLYALARESPRCTSSRSSPCKWTCPCWL